MTCKKLDIVGVGLATLDVLLRYENLPTWERGTRFSELRLDGGGMVGTALVAASRLGARTGYVGVCGDDEFARRKVQSLVCNGVDTSRLIKRKGSETQIVVCYVHAKTGERLFSGREGFRAQPLRPRELDRKYITSAKYLHLDGFHHEGAMQAAQWMREAGGRVVLDAGKTSGSVAENMRELVRSVDTLICGAGFLQALTGRRHTFAAGTKALAYGPSTIVQTEGSEGCCTITAEDRFHTPAFPVEVMDTTGAGDVFHGAYLVGLLRGWNPRSTATFASAVSAIKCTRMGGREGIPGMEEVKSFLNERGTAIENINR